MARIAAGLAIGPASIGTTMDVFAADPFNADVSQVTLDLYTAAYRVSGYMSTRFHRVSDLLNQATTTHLLVEQATISEFAEPAGTLGARQVHVALEEVLLCVAAIAGTAQPDMRIPKRPVKAQLGVPPFRVTGTLHVPVGGRPADGLLNAADRFVTITDATIAVAGRPEATRTVEAVAVQRRAAHVVLVADDERPDELLAEILDERTAREWLAARDARTGGREGREAPWDDGISRRGG
jgi:hypothetical protein